MSKRQHCFFFRCNIFSLPAVSKVSQGKRSSLPPSAGKEDCYEKTRSHSAVPDAGRFPVAAGTGRFHHRKSARRVFRRKAALYRGAPLSFVTCSRWLREQASRSALLRGKELTAIPNPIDPAAFRPQDKAAARKHWGTLLPGGQRLILFGACRFTDKRKGIDYFIDSCRILARRRPEWAGKVGIALFGQGDGQQLAREIPYPVYPLGQLRSGEEMALAYNAADHFVTPSLEENLPNTIMEAMACGLPCAGFRIGGIPEMIDHKRNGFLAEYKSAEDLAAGMDYILGAANYEELSRAAIDKVARCYDPARIAEEYLQVYRRALAQTQL